MSKEAMKLVPVEPTEEMLKAMDECSKEGYDERLYAGHAASVYMAAVDAAPTQPLRHEHAEQLAKLGWQYFECPACVSGKAKVFPMPAQPQHEPVATVRSFGDLGGTFDWASPRTYRPPVGAKLYASPPASKPLTDEQIAEIAAQGHQRWIEFARAIEAAHGIFKDEK